MLEHSLLQRRDVLADLVELIKNDLISNLQVFLIFTDYLAANHRVLHHPEGKIFIQFLCSVLTLDVLSKEFPNDVFLQVCLTLESHKFTVHCMDCRLQRSPSIHLRWLSL